MKSRRKFLGGGAAVPLILTVHPGSAVAATSSQCRIRDAEFQPTPELLPSPTSDPSNPDPDVWLRAEVAVLSLENNGTPVAGQYIRSISGTSPDAYWRIDGVAVPQQSVITPGLTVTETPTGQTRRALVQVDTSGNIIGFSWDTTKSGQKITKSCWTSFR